MDTLNDIFEEVLQYEAENNISKLPLIMEGRVITSSMINFATCVTKAYRICYTRLVHCIDNTNDLSPDELNYCTHINMDHFFQNVVSKRVTLMAVNCCYVSALQKYYIFWEEKINFTVESLIVKKPLDDAKVCKLKHHSSVIKHIDAHKHRPTLHHSCGAGFSHDHRGTVKCQTFKVGLFTARSKPIDFMELSYARFHLWQ
jgi:hypothetical protein